VYSQCTKGCPTLSLRLVCYLSKKKKRLCITITLGIDQVFHFSSPTKTTENQDSKTFSFQLSNKKEKEKKVGK